MDYPEGATPLDPDELEGLKFKHIQTRGELNQMELVNIQTGMMWLSKQKSPNILTIELCKALHKRLFGDVWRWAVDLRQTEKNIGVDPLRISVELLNLLNDAKAWIEYETYSPKEAALRFHHRLVYIHLFANGNGRHARIMADALLKHRYNSPGLSWLRQDLLHVNDTRRQYIAALRQADGHNMQPLLVLFDLE